MADPEMPDPVLTNVQELQKKEAAVMGELRIRQHSYSRHRFR